MREVYTGNRKDTEGLVILFTWYMLDGLLNLILEASSQGFVRRAELSVSEMLVKIGWGEKGKLDRRTEESLGKEEYAARVTGFLSDSVVYLRVAEHNEITW